MGMNPYSGDIERFPSRESIPQGWLELSPAEAAELLTLPKDLRIKRYMKAHGKEKCPTCGCFISNHSLNRFKLCAATELGRLDTERLEAIIAEASETPALESAQG